MGIGGYVREVIQSAILVYLMWQVYKSKRK